MVAPTHPTSIHHESGCGHSALDRSGPRGTVNGIVAPTTITTTNTNGPRAPNGHVPHATAAKPIAICGMACRLPRGIRTPAQLWEFLLAGGDARSRVPESRYNVDAFYDPSGKPGTTKTQHGYFLDEDLTRLDAALFSMPRKEVERTDPQQRLLLEVARECFEDAGETDWKGKKIGCYVGNLGDDWLEMLAQDTQNYGVYRLSGYGDYSLSNRISFEMDLQGPSVTVRTACSASMVALHEACVAIQRGDCVSAIVGGTSLILRPGLTTMMSEQGMLSPDGSSKTFSAEANGYARGEAIVGVFVKPLEDAIRDGNAIRAVIRATATNHDGKTASFTLPNPDAQEAVIRRAYQAAGLDIADTGYFECHGTGTPVGDPIETAAVARIFGDVGITIGSTKPNFGHTEGASGMLSVLKSVLMLEHKRIPPSIKYAPKNPKIPWETGRLSLAEEPLSWPGDRLERISVNSFGVGGSNAHAIIDSAPNHRPPPVDNQIKEDTAQVLLYSANSQQSLTRLIENYKKHVEQSTSNIDQVAYTLARGREHLKYRAFAIAYGSVVTSTSPATKPSQSKPKIAMVFTGQGAQWPQMGGDLLKSNPTFRSSIRALDKYLTYNLGDEAPDWTIEKELLKPAKRSRIGLAEFAQPLCTAVQIALVDTLRSVGVEADAVVGHSSGELAGAYASGALTAGEAIVAALYRGIVANAQIRPGAMAALGLGVADAESFLLPNTCIASINSPRSVTISGDVDQIEHVIASVRAARPDVLARKLQVDKAYHSYHMEEIADIYNASIEHRVVGRSPDKPFFSSVEGRLLDGSTSLSSRYWQKNLESPVLFSGAASALLRHFSNQEVILLEIGPHSVLAGPLAQIMAETQHNAKYIPTFIRFQNATENFLTTIGKLYTSHAPINLRTLFPHGSCLPDLPRYPFHHGDASYRFESRLSKEHRLRKHAHHDLLGARVLESSDIEPAWRNVLHIGFNTTWLKHHKVGEDIVFPFAGYVAIAGEAIRQVSKVEDAFRVRCVTIHTAMLLSEEKPTEIITSLRPLRSTVSQNSWYEFTIAAHNGTQWTQHCSGQVKVESGTAPMGKNLEPWPRAVARERWFDGVRREGLDLGSDFQNLDGITSSTTTHEAQGVISSKKHPLNLHSPYHIHPAVLDSVLQLHLVAAAHGLVRKHRNFLPVFCDQLLVTRTPGDFVADVKVTSMGREAHSSRLVEGKGIVNGKVALHFEGMEFAPARINGDLEGEDLHAAARLTWTPDIDLVDIQSLFRTSPDRQEHLQALEELGRLSILKIRDQLATLDPQTPHLERYARWIESQAESVKTTSDLDGAWSGLRDSLAETPVAPVVDVLNAVVSNLDSILHDRTSSWEPLLPKATVARFFDFLSDSNSEAFFKTLGRCKPNLRILEVGSWSRRPSNTVLQSLSSNGHNLRSQYTFAPKRPATSEDRLNHYSDLEYITLDIGKDLSDQGLQDGQYDIVVANDISHTTPNLAQSLRNIHKLLSPDGRLFLQELSPASTWINIILGTDPAWWDKDVDDRSPEPYIDITRWQKELTTAGFDHPEAIDLENATQVSCAIVSRARRRFSDRTSRPVHLLVRDKDKTYDVMERCLREQGYEVTKITLNDVPQPDVEIISIIDLDGPFLDNITDETFYDLQHFITTLQRSSIFWVTKPCHIQVQDPRYSQVIGLARVIRSELLIDFATCEIDDVEASFPLIGRAFEKFRLRRDDSSHLSPDFEFAIHQGIINIGRYLPFTLMDDFRRETEGERMKVVTGTPGRLNTLQWIRQPDPPPLGEHELEIEMHAAGVNFKDVLVSMGLVGYVGRYHGLEGAGVVRRVGSGVTEFQPGDRVAALEHNMMSTLLIANEAFCVKIPDSLSFTDAATMFMVFATVQQALIEIGRLRKGESLLIHSACGGVGLAAIQIAQMIGAEIYATVGSETKAQYLVDNYHIPRHRIFHSRDNSFVEGVYRETHGRGVDQVLNSLSGELLHESWRCVAPHGKLLELGKRELLDHGKLDMAPFAANRSYCCIDIDAFYDVSSRRFKEMMLETLTYHSQGHIHPLPIAALFPATSVAEAFKYLLPGTHIGRVVISLRSPSSPSSSLVPPPSSPSPPAPLLLSPSASYLLIGGLGGLGRSIATFMLERGARNLIYLSRSAGTSESDRAFLRELTSMGACALAVPGDVTNPSDVAAAVAKAESLGPLKGVLQLSTVQAEENFERMSVEQWRRTTGPKVQGTWNLHAATAGRELEFFVMASSIAAAVGIPGQANYAAANAYLDAFVQFRREKGLRASAIALGPVADMGLLAERAALQRTAALVGSKTVGEKELLDAVALAMMGGGTGGAHSETSRQGAVCGFVEPNTFVLGLANTGLPLDNPANRTVWKKDRRMAIYHNLDRARASAGSASDGSDQQGSRNGKGPASRSPSASTDPLKAFLANARADPALLTTPAARNKFSSAIGRRLFGLLLRDVNELEEEEDSEDVAVNGVANGTTAEATGSGVAKISASSLADLGLDSLVAIELRAWWRQTFGFDVSVLEMLGAGTLDSLGGLACERFHRIVTEEGKG